MTDLDFVGRDAGFVRNLRGGAILIESCERRKVFLRNGRSTGRGDECIRIRRIADDEHFDRLLRHRVEQLALRLEDFGILGQHVFTFHAGLAGEGADQNGNVNVGERLRLIRRAFDAVQIWECAILKEFILKIVISKLSIN